jgi:hypothetical protein
MKPEIKRFLVALHAQAESYHADVSHASTFLVEREHEYREIRSRVDPLIKSVDQPRFVDLAAQREACMRDRPQPHPRPPAAVIPQNARILAPVPVRGVSFLQEKCSPFRAYAEKVARGRAYPSFFHRNHVT